MKNHPKIRLLFRALVIIMWVLVDANSAYGQLSELFFGIKPENRQFLRYNYFENGFDSAAISYQVGEFTIVNGSNSQRVNLDYLPTTTVITGTSATGVSYDLAAVAKTNEFELPTTSFEVKFYREMSVHALPCDSWSGGGGSGGSGGNASDIYWNVGADKVLDQTEFIMELVLSSTNTVIATIDSVGTMPNTTSNVVPYYGTEPNKLVPYRSVFVGVGNIGKKAYIRISPRRYGATPLGLQLRQISSWFNWSAAFQRDGVGSYFLISATHADSIANLYLDEVIAYCDSVKTATGSLPENISGVVMAEEQDSIFKARYFDQHADSLGRVYYTEKAPTPKQGLQMPRVVGDTRVAENVSVSIVSVRPHPVSHKIFEIVINNQHTPLPITLRLMPIYGGNPLQVWEGLVSSGQQRININRSEFAAGVYYLVVYDVVGNYLSAAKIALQ